MDSAVEPAPAYRLEEKQTQRKLQLPGLISITDHDNIKAGTLLRLLDRSRHAPVSTEWTIPFGPTFFHLGIHNLPASEGAAIIQQLRRFTAKPDRIDLGRQLSLVTSHPGPWSSSIILSGTRKGSEQSGTLLSSLSCCDNTAGISMRWS